MPFTPSDPSVKASQGAGGTCGHASPEPLSPTALSPWHLPPSICSLSFYQPEKLEIHRDWEELLLPPGKSRGAELRRQLHRRLNQGPISAVSKKFSLLPPQQCQGQAGVRNAPRQKLTQESRLGRGGSGRETGSPKAQPLLHTSVTSVKSLFPFRTRDRTGGSAAQTRGMMDQLLDRSRGFPQNC